MSNGINSKVPVMGDWRLYSSRTATTCIVILTLLAVAALGVGLVRAASGIDRSASRHEEQLVGNGLKLKDQALRDCIAPQTMWDEAVGHLDNRYDPDWAASNLGQYLTSTCALQGVYVVAAGGEVLGAWSGGKTAPAQLPTELRAPIQGLVAAIRQRELARGAFPARPVQTSLIAKPIDETDVVATAAGAVVIAATLVQPDFGSSLPKAAQAPIVISVQPIDQAYLDWIRTYYLIGDFRLGGTPSGRSAVAALNNRQGQPVVSFHWAYEQPVRDLTRGIAPSVGFLLMVLLVVPAVTIWRDRRHTQRLRDAIAAANSASEAKSRFIANMSHEIRTPMNGVLGVLHILRQKSLDADSQRLIEEAMASGVLLQGLLNDVLDLSRIEEGRLELDPQPVDLAGALDEVVGLFAAQAAQKGVDLVGQVAGEAGLVLADGLRLRQVMLNLVSNAVKFSSQGQVQARLALSPVQADGRRRVRLEVQDNGVGVPQSAQPQIFGRFAQADGSVSRRFGGSGLGLSICQALVELMEGEIGFSSVEGEGSTFWFQLDLAAVSGPDVAAEAEVEIIGLEGIRILIVEDNPTNRLVASRILEAFGAEIETACDGAQGLAAAKLGGHDLILMDIQMPVMDGLTATREIRALAGGVGQTPVIGLTANVLASQKQSYLAAGMNDVADKPINPASLLAKIAQALGGAGEVASEALAG